MENLNERFRFDKNELWWQVYGFAVAKDKDKGTGWERFDFNKDAPLDEDDSETEGKEFASHPFLLFNHCASGFI